MPVTVYDGAGNPTTLSRVIRENFETPFLEALDNNTFMLQFFPRKTAEGESVSWKVHFQGNTGVAWYAEADAYEASGKQSYENATVKIKMVRINVEFSGLAAAATKNNQAAYVNVKTDEIKRGTDDLRNNINDKMIAFAAPAAKEIDNINKIVSDTGIYAGIDRGTTSWFRSFVLANAAVPRPLGVGLMQQMLEELEKPLRSAKTSAILTSRRHVDQYGDLADARRRFGGNSTTVDLGVASTSYMDIPIVAVPKMANGRMFFIDKSDWGTYFLQPFGTQDVPASKDATILALYAYLQLVCKAPHKQGQIADLQS